MPHTFGIVGIPLRGRGPYEKPSPGAIIDPQHPLAQGLVGGWLLNSNGLNSVDKGRLTFTAAPTYGYGEGGSALKLDGTYSGAQSITTLDYPFSLVTRARCNALDGVIVSVGKGNNTFNSSVALQSISTLTRYRIISFNETVANRELFSTNNSAKVGEWQSVAGVLASTANAKLYVDTVESSSTADVGAVTPFVSCRLGAYQSIAIARFNGDISYAYLYSRALNPTEIGQLHASPYQMFWTKKRTIFVPLVTAGAFVCRKVFGVVGVPKPW